MMLSKKMVIELSLLIFIMSGALPVINPTVKAANSPSTITENHAHFQERQAMFIQNAGQLDERVLFQVHGNDSIIWITEDGIWITMMAYPSSDQSSSLHPEKKESKVASREYLNEYQRGVNLHITFPGANPHPHIEPFGRAEFSVNYFIGNDPQKWRTNVPVWRGVRYIDLYPGIDLEFTGEGGYLIPRLVVRTPSLAGPLLENSKAGESVRLKVEGADMLKVVKDNLLVSTPLGNFTLPLLQVVSTSSMALTQPELHPQHNSVEISSPFTTIDSETAPSYPQSSSSLLYATFLGGSGADKGYDLAVDNAGNAYVIGHTYGSGTFPTTPGAFDTTYSGEEAYVVKLNAAGSSLVYATFLGGGSVVDEGRGIAVDGDGNAYVIGDTWSSDFPTTSLSFNPTYHGNGDTFIVKLNSSGSNLIYSGFLGGTIDDYSRSIAVDGGGNAYVTGWTNSSDFPTTPGAFNTTYYGSDAFAAKISADGSNLLYSTLLGGTGLERSNDISIDATGYAYLTGYSDSSDFQTTPGSFDPIYNSEDDAFLVKISPNGDDLIYSTFLGGSNDDQGESIAVDTQGNVYVTGTTLSSDFPTTTGALDTLYNGVEDAFVAKFNTSGSSLLYASYLGGGGEDHGLGIVVDGEERAYVTGWSESSDYPTTSTAFDSSYNGLGDTVIALLNSTGSGLLYATYIGGNYYDYGYSIDLDEAGNVYLTGETWYSDFPSTPSAYDPTFNGGGGDAFVLKIAVEGETEPFTGSITPIWQTAHALPSQVMQGGIAYRHFRLLDDAGIAIPSATIAFSTGSTAVTDSQGYFTATIQADSLGLPGSYSVSVQDVIIGGQDYTTNNQPVFPVEVSERRYAHSWSYGSMRKASAEVNSGLVAFINAETNGGIKLSLQESDPDQTNDDTVVMDENYSIEAGSGVGAGIRQNISAGIVQANLGASVTSEASLRSFGELEAQFEQPYTENDRKAQGIFLTLSLFDSTTGIPIQPLTVGMLRVAEKRTSYTDYISAQSSGLAAKITPIHVNVNAKAGLAAKRSGGQSKGATLGFTLMDVGVSRLVAMVLSDYGDEYSLGFDDEISVDLTLLSPSLPYIKSRLIGILGNNARRLHKEYFFDSTTNQLKRIELTLSSEGNPAIFNDVTKKQVSIRMILQDGSLTPDLVEEIGQAQTIADLNALLSALPEIPYVVEVEDGSSVNVVPELSIPGTEIHIGLGLEVESLRNLIREEGVFLNGKHYITESYTADTLVSRSGKTWWELTSNALGGLWLLVQDAFEWVGQQVSSGTSWVLEVISKTASGTTRGGAQITVSEGTQISLREGTENNTTLGQTDTLTVTAISWVPELTTETTSMLSHPAIAPASGEGFVVGGIYEFQPYTLTISPAATLVITYTEEAVVGIDENDIGMFRWNAEDNNWQPLSATADTVSNSFTATTNQLGTFTLGFDATPPQITIQSPNEGSVITNTMPIISALVVDTGTGINPSTVQMQLDGQPVTAQFVTSTGGLFYLPSAPLTDGSHLVSVSAADVLGNSTTSSMSFTVEVIHRVYLPLVLCGR